jgi:DNA replicative helicase MCM subunit Mcm2 (Cdc46/Mcm family)
VPVRENGALRIIDDVFSQSRLSDVVEEADAEVAMDLINYAYYNEAKPLDRPKRRPAHGMPR